MSQHEHTPGPWKGDKGSLSRPIRNEAGEPFAWVDFENDADYVLTLAAPDMLKALRAVDKALSVNAETGKWQMADDFDVEPLVQAIAKAEGRTNPTGEPE